MGANIPGKPRLFLPYIGGLGVYARKCEEIVQGGYEGFAFSRSIRVAAGEVEDGAG
jgi:cyclohexanone monooxygenase